MESSKPLPKLRLAPKESAEELAQRCAREQRASNLQRESELENSLAPFRVGSVRYLNAVPLTRGLEEQAEQVRRAGEDEGTGTGERFQKQRRQRLLQQDRTRTLKHERHEDVPEAVRMPERDGAHDRVGGPDPDGRGDVARVGEKLPGGRQDAARPSGAPGGQTDDGSVAVAESSLEATARALGRDSEAYHRLFAPFVRAHEQLLPALLGPLRWPDHPILLARFGLRALRSAESVANAYFRGPLARALFAGCAAHSILPFDRLTSSAVGLVFLLVAHAKNWPFPRGGSDAIVGALTQSGEHALRAALDKAL